MTPRILSELTKLLPPDFDRGVVIQTERLDAYDLLDPTSKASQTVQKWIDDLPKGGVIFWRPPRRLCSSRRARPMGSSSDYGAGNGLWWGWRSGWGGESKPKDADEKTHFYSGLPHESGHNQELFRFISSQHSEADMQEDHQTAVVTFHRFHKQTSLMLTLIECVRARNNEEALQEALIQVNESFPQGFFDTQWEGPETEVDWEDEK